MEKIKELVWQGYSVREISKIIWRPSGTVSSWIRKEWLHTKWNSGRPVWRRWDANERKKRKDNNHWVKHNMWGTKFYMLFFYARYRCNNPKANWYHSYWGRWIKFMWSSFEEYRDDMYHIYLEKLKTIPEVELSIERVDVDWNYCKENCTFIRKNEQQWNQQRQKRMRERKCNKLYVSYKKSSGNREKYFQNIAPITIELL
jgi:hypothetical protein